jgi:hypothetical protein
MKNIMNKIAEAYDKDNMRHPTHLLLTVDQGFAYLKWFIDEQNLGYTLPPELEEVLIFRNVEKMKDMFHREEWPMKYLGVSIEIIDDHQPTFVDRSPKAAPGRLRQAQAEGRLFSELYVMLEEEAGVDLHAAHKTFFPEQ